MTDHAHSVKPKIYPQAWRLTWRAVQSRRLWMSMLTTLGVLTVLWVFGMHFAPDLVRVWHLSGTHPSAAVGRASTIGPGSVAHRIWWPWILGALVLGLGFFWGLVPWSTARFYDHLVQELGVVAPASESTTQIYTRGVVWFAGFFGFWLLWSIVSTWSLAFLPWWGTIGVALGLLGWGLPHLFRWFGSLFVDRQPWRHTGRAWRGWDGSGLFWSGLGIIALSTGLIMGLGWLAFHWAGMTAPWWVLLALGLSADLVWESVATIWMVALYIAWQATQSPESAL